MTATCAFPECEMLGVFEDETTGPDGEPIIGMLCFTHSQGDVIVAQEPDETGFHVDVVAGLAAMVLEHTAMTTLDTADATGDAMRSLAKATMWGEDVAAGVLLATTYMMAAGQITADELLHGAELYERQAETDDVDVLAPEDVDQDDDVTPASVLASIEESDDGAIIVGGSNQTTNQEGQDDDNKD